MPDRLWSITEAADLLAVPRSWLRDKVTARAVPHARLGRHVRFTAEHLRCIIAAGEASAGSAPGPRPTGGLRQRSKPAAPSHGSDSAA